MKSPKSMRSCQLLLLFLFPNLLLLQFSAAQALIWPEWKAGSGKPANVKTIQLLLQSHGYKLKPDGVFGKTTKNQLQKFQAKHRLPKNGITTARTWEELILRVRSGSKGPAVRALQLQLKLIGYDIKVDGIFGPQTQRAVKAFQAAQTLTPDGIAGRHTWNRLVMAAALYYEDG